MQTMRYEINWTSRPGEKERRGELEEGRAGAAALVGRGAVVCGTATVNEEGG